MNELRTSWKAGFVGEAKSTALLDLVLAARGGRAHQTEAHRTVSGPVFPAHRRVLPVQDGRVVAKPVITVDFSDIVVEVTRPSQGDRG